MQIKDDVLVAPLGPQTDDLTAIRPAELAALELGCEAAVELAASLFVVGVCRSVSVI